MPDSRNRLLIRIAAPEDEPMTLDQVKLYLRVTHEEEDVLIHDLLITARISAEQWLKRSLMTQTWKLAYDDYLPESVSLPMGPVQNIVSVTVVNRDGTTQVIEDTMYDLNAAKDRIVFLATLVGYRLEIVYGTGFESAEEVPLPIRQGMLAHVAAMYDSRGESESGMLPPQTTQLYMPFREVQL